MYSYVCPCVFVVLVGIENALRETITYTVQFKCTMWFQKIR